VKIPRPIKLLLIGAGSLLLIVGVVAVAGYLSAPYFYLTRSIFWGESDYKDHKKFPAREVHNAAPVSRFDELPADNPYASQIEAIARTIATAASKITLKRAGRLRFSWSTTRS
jgi:hypothetical protein